jgi:lysophospholipase L1-like esterase
MVGSRRLVFLGDSITAQGRWAEWFPEDETHNFGVEGSTTEDVVGRLPGVVAAKPDAVVILVGTNDLAWRHPVERTVRTFETIVVTLRKELPIVRILVQSIFPRSSDFTVCIQDINRHVRQFAPTVYAQYVDLWPTLAVESGGINPAYSSDCLHLNEAGYAAWLAELRPAVERLFALPPTSTSITLPR